MWITYSRISSSVQWQGNQVVSRIPSQILGLEYFLLSLMVTCPIYENVSNIKKNDKIYKYQMAPLSYLLVLCNATCTFWSFLFTIYTNKFAVLSSTCSPVFALKVTTMWLWCWPQVCRHCYSNPLSVSAPSRFYYSINRSELYIISPRHVFPNEIKFHFPFLALIPLILWHFYNLVLLPVLYKVLQGSSGWRSPIFKAFS